MKDKDIFMTTMFRVVKTTAFPVVVYEYETRTLRKSGKIQVDYFDMDLEVIIIMDWKENQLMDTKSNKHSFFPL